MTRARDVVPHRDYGFYGPDSVTWKVFSYPTSLSVGFQRTVVIEMFEPFLLASVEHTGAVRGRPALRYDRTLRYVATVAFHDSASAISAADVLMRIHSRIRGIEPISGLPYDANDPEAQLWIHLTQWHSVLLAYETFGPGKLTEDEELRYWAECRRAAELQTIDPDAVPRSREEMSAYYERMRPRLAATAATQEVVEHLLNASASLLDDLPLYQRIARPFVRTAFRKATIATLPRWLRRLGGIRQGRIQDTLIITTMRIAFRTLFLTRWSRLRLLEVISPQTAPVAAPALFAIPPLKRVTVSPADAWKRSGRPTAREQYAAQLASRPPEPVAAAPPDPGAERLEQFT